MSNGVCFTGSRMSDHRQQQQQQQRRRQQAPGTLVNVLSVTDMNGNEVICVTAAAVRAPEVVDEGRRQVLRVSGGITDADAVSYDETHSEDEDVK